MIERWNGSKWRLQDSPNPSYVSQLSGVSCSSSRACMAVGSMLVVGSWTPLIERWDGRAWTVSSFPTGHGEFLGVSCTAANACTAVGVTGLIGGGGPLLVRWNGSAWSLQTTPVSGSPEVSDGYADVSCPARRRCVVAGNPAGERPSLIDRWNGAKWSLRRPPSGKPGVLTGGPAHRSDTALRSDSFMPVV